MLTNTTDFGAYLGIPCHAGGSSDNDGDNNNSSEPLISGADAVA